MKFHSLEDFGGADSSRKLFQSWGWTSTNDFDEADVIIFNGGADIGTEIYHETPVFSDIPKRASLRDQTEIELFNEYKGKKFLLGICRGSQLLNCLNGGTLWQHVNRHGVNHDMIDLRSGKTLRVTSTHHQMMRPNLKTGTVIGIANESSIKLADGVNQNLAPYPTRTVEDGADIEVVWYPGNTTLCVQGHPEYVPGSEFAEWTKFLIETCMAEAKCVA